MKCAIINYISKKNKYYSKEGTFHMETITKGNKLFKSGKFLMTAAATVAVIASATAPALISANADSTSATTSVSADPTHTVANWKANDQTIIAANFKSQNITSVDQLASYKVVWGDTLSGIAQHFNTTVDKITAQFGITDPNFIVSGVAVQDQHLYAAPTANTTAATTVAQGTTSAQNATTGATASHGDASSTNNSVVSGSTGSSQAAATSSDDTHIGGASDVIGSVDTGANAGSGSASTVPANGNSNAASSSEAPAAGSHTGSQAGSSADDTNIGGASSVIGDVDNGSGSGANVTPTTPAGNNSQASSSSEAPAGSDAGSAAPTKPADSNSNAGSSSAAPTTPTPSTGNDTEPSTVVPVNPKDGDHFNGVDSLTGYSYGILTYQASTGYWLDTFGNDRDPYNPQNIRHTADQIAAIKAADEKAHEIVPGTDITRPDDGDTNIGGASDVIGDVNNGSGSDANVTPTTPADNNSQASSSSEAPAASDAGSAAPTKPADSNSNAGSSSTVPAVSNSDASTAAPTDSASSAATTPQTPATSGSDTSTVAPTTNGSDAASSSAAPSTPKPSTGNDAQPSTVVPANPKDGDHFNGVDSLTGLSYGILTYQASTGYWLDTFGNDRDPYNPQNIRHTADQIAAIKAADEKAHEIVDGTELTRPDDGADSGSSNIGSASDVISSIIGG